MIESSPRGVGRDKISQVEEWIRERNPGLDQIDRDLDLIGSRLIDSLAFVEFIFLLESVRGYQIDIETLDVDDMRTLRSIENRILVPE